MSTVRDLLKSSLRKIGALATGETPSSEEINDALKAFNALVDSWSNENLLIPYKVRETLTLTANDATYTFGGSGADITTSRPMRIEQAAIALNDQEFPMLVATKEQWANVSLKTTTSNIPVILYPEMTDTSVTLNIWPVPSAANTLVLYSWKPLTTYTNLSTTLTLPPGYERALIYNTAIELCPEYGLEASNTVVATAMEAKANIKRMNTKSYFLTPDDAVRPERQTYNWWIGGYE